MSKQLSPTCQSSRKLLVEVAFVRPILIILLVVYHALLCFTSLFFIVDFIYFSQRDILLKTHLVLW